MSWAARWAPALIVALGAAVATAHGLYEVAVAAKVPGAIAWLYPLVTDGLAMVAYSATGRLVGKAGGYAWACVIVAAGLSGLAQAVYLAADTVQADPVLRFGVGAWPAVACALVAHLLHLIVTADDEQQRGQLDERDGRDLPGETAPAAVEPGQDRVPSPATAAGPLAAAAGGAGPGHGATLPRPLQRPAISDHQDQDERGDNQDREGQDEDEGAAASGDARVRLLVELLAAGCEVTGPQAAVVLTHHTGAPVSDRTARRLLATARQPTTPVLPAPPGPGGRVHLHLLPTGTGLTTTGISTTDTSTQSREGDL